MKEKMLYKTLVVGVIVLFIGVGVQPAIATVENDSIEKDDDCNLCAKKVSKPNLVFLKGLLDIIDRNINKLSVISKNNPILEKKYPELFTKITILKEVSNELNNDIHTNSTFIFGIHDRICNFLSALIEYFLTVSIWLEYSMLHLIMTFHFVIVVPMLVFYGIIYYIYFPLMIIETLIFC
jgi:hypothetical protein